MSWIKTKKLDIADVELFSGNIFSGNSKLLWSEYISLFHYSNPPEQKYMMTVLQFINDNKGVSQREDNTYKF